MSDTVLKHANIEKQDQSDRLQGLRDRLNSALVGKEDVVEMVIACLISNGHLLFDDLPGLGKTTLAKALAQSIGGRFARVQCTPDLLPSDITGFNIFDQKNQRFEFREGPVFSDVLLTDEINRATPRTQSALFEAMAERQVTLDNRTYALPDCFMVIATQNPIESHGAFPLPEAQLDRFSMKLSIGYPSSDHEVAMLGSYVGGRDIANNDQSVLSLNHLLEIQSTVESIEVCESVRRYLVELGNSSRSHASVKLGLSPRGLITWQRVSQAWAYLQGRMFVIPDDVKAVAYPVLRLRISEKDRHAGSIIDEVIKSVPVPNETPT
ncbi:MAG: MoxR family ATPase [Planctomycetota bacterium]